MRLAALVCAIALCGCVYSRRARSDGGAGELDASGDDGAGDGAGGDASALADASSDAVSTACDETGFVLGRMLVAPVSLVNPSDALAVEGVTVRGTGRICVAQQSPTQTVAWTEGTPGSRYELRFTAAGYAPYTVAFDSGLAPRIEPVVMVRGVVLGPVTLDAASRPVRGAWGTRPGAGDLYVGLDGAWRVVRRASSVLSVTGIALPAPSHPDNLPSPSFTPDGEVALLPTAPRDVFAFTCAAVSASSGVVLARDLAPAFCTNATFAALGPVGLATDDRTAASVVFTWGSAGFRELRRAAGLNLTALDAAGARALRSDARGNPLIYDVAAGTDAAPSRATENLRRTARRRYLLADGTATLFAESDTEGGLAGRSCGAGGCSLYLEPVGAPFRSIATGVAAWALSRTLPALVYVTPTGELHRYDLAASSDTTISVMPFDAARTFAFEDAFVLQSSANVQVVHVARGAVVVTLAGSLTLEPDPRVGFTPPAALTLARACPTPDCDVYVVDLRAFRVTRSAATPFFGGALAWSQRALGQFASGDARLPAAGWALFAGAGSEISETAYGAITAYPCVPFRWQSQWVCAP